MKNANMSIVPNKCGRGGIGRRAGLRNQYFGVKVQVLSSAPHFVEVASKIRRGHFFNVNNRFLESLLKFC